MSQNCDEVMHLYRNGSVFMVFMFPKTLKYLDHMIRVPPLELQRAPLIPACWCFPLAALTLNFTVPWGGDQAAIHLSFLLPYRMFIEAEVGAIKDALKIFRDFSRAS